jgi:hypothetical protein
MTTTDKARGPARRRWPWWLRSPHSRLFSEWIELKSDHNPQTPPAVGGDPPAQAA